jgi:iron complex outermembrane receptor protein
MQDLFMDLALYHNDVKDEIVQIQNAEGYVIYDNAGKTRKKGLEFTTVYNVSEEWDLGGAYAYSDYKFVTFEEQVGYGSRATWESREGNYLPYIPKNQYSLFTALQMDNGVKGRLTTRSWGSYYMDSANTQKYEGFDLVTDLMLGYEYQTHSIQLNISNLTNEYYAMEALKDANGAVTYKAAAPRSAMVTYSYQF